MDGTKLKGLLWLVAALGLGAFFALGLSIIAYWTPWSWEQKLASAVGEQFFGVECAGSRSVLQPVLKRLYPLPGESVDFELDVRIVQNAQINAFAALGGRIVIFDGLLKQAQSADELAGVLAHELEHIRKRHVIQGVMSRSLSTVLFGLIQSGVPEVGPEIGKVLLELRFGRAQEDAADEGALERLKAAKISVLGFKRFFQRVSELGELPALLSDHPSGEDRIRRVEKYAGGVSEPILSHAQWKALQGICR